MTTGYRGYGEMVLMYGYLTLPTLAPTCILFVTLVSGTGILQTFLYQILTVMYSVLQCIQFVLENSLTGKKLC